MAEVKSFTVHRIVYDSVFVLAYSAAEAAQLAGRPDMSAGEVRRVMVARVVEDTDQPDLFEGLAHLGGAADDHPSEDDE